MSEQQSSYRQIFKATSLFGGVQVFNVLIGVIRVKFVAVLLGTTGVGIIGLFNAPLNLISSLTGLGIAFSAVRDVSEANGSGNQSRIANAITVLRRWSWFTGLIGAMVTAILSPQLSQWSFGSREYTWSFIWLSSILLIQALSKSQVAIMQGTRKLKDMAKAGVAGSGIGLILSIPLYYYYGTKGIVPALILSAVTALFLSWYYSRNTKIEQSDITYKETFFAGLGMVKLGIYMTLAGFLGTFSNFILNAYISNKGGIDQVGLYNAGWGIVGQYTGIIFTAMATDYFPRLAAIQNDNLKIKELVKQQAETAVLIMTPLLALLIVTMPLVIKILYSKEFLPVVMFANLTVLGMQIKAISWAMGYVYLAKGNGRLFLILEVIAGLMILSMNLLFYDIYGLNGLGLSFILTIFLGVIINYLVLSRSYDFSFTKDFIIRISVCYSFILLSFLTVFIEGQFIRVGISVFIMLIATVYSFWRLNKLMNLRALIMNRIGKKENFKN